MKCKHRKWKAISDSEITHAYSTSDSISNILKILQVSIRGTSNFATLKKRLTKLNLSYNQKVIQGRQTGKRNSRITKSAKFSNDKVFTSNSSISRHAVKKRFRLITQHTTCSICNQQPTWNNKPLVMRLDHINGINNDNTISNLRLVCPNCDSQLDTFCSKNMGARVIAKPKQLDKRTGPKPLKRKYDRPSKEELIELIKKHPITVIAKELGVKSDNLIRKWCSTYNIAHQSLSPYGRTKRKNPL